MNRLVSVSTALVVALTLLPAGAVAALESTSVQRPVANLDRGGSLLIRPANLEIRDVTLAEALTSLREHAGVDVVFSPTLLPAARRVSCDCRSSAVEEALDRMLEGTGFGYFAMPLQIVIRAPESAAEVAPLRMGSVLPVAFASRSRPGARALVAPVSQAADSVAGTVLNAATGQPLSGAAVRVAGTGRGVLTDARGRFRVAADRGGRVSLQVQMVGYAPLTASAAVGATNLELRLEPAALVLEGVVVSALGMERAARSLGYSVARATPEEVTANRTPNFMNALQGKVAGVSITPMGTGPQGSSKVRIRGQSSIGANNSPLIVINGVPVDNTTFGVSGDVGQRGSNRNSDSGDGLSSINPDDITDISILKGAAAAALYGARAKDGVIMISTRNRAVGSGIQFELTSSYSHDTPLDYRDYQFEYGQGENGRRPGWDGRSMPVSGVWSFGEKFEPGKTQILFDGAEVPYEPQRNQVLQFYRNGQNVTNTLRVSQGTENGGFSASVSNLSSSSIFPTSDYTRNTVNFGFTQTVAEKLDVSGNINYSNEDRPNPANIAEQDYSTPVVLYTIGNSMPMDLLREKAFTPEGNEMLWSRFNNRTNPYFALSRFENNVRDRVYGNLSASYALLDWLSVMGRMGQDYWSRDQDYNLPTGSVVQAPAPAGFVNGQYVQDVSALREINADFLVTGKGTRGNLGLSANVGGNVMRRKLERNNVLVTDFYSRGSYTLSNGRLLSPQYSLSERQVNSLYGSADLSFRDMLFLNATARNDWFSTLSDENRSILYPSVSSSFVFTEALRAPSWLDFGKLRAAYAEVGSDTDVPPYADNLFYSINANLFRNVALGGINTGTVPNPDLRPMRLSEWELGTELSLFNRLRLDLGYYHRIASDQILNQQISTASGFASRRVNIGQTRNRGAELLVDAALVQRPDFGWNVVLNGNYNVSKVLDLGQDIGVNQIVVGNADFHGQLRQVVGEEMNQLYGWGWLRDPQGRIIHSPVNGLPMRSTEQLSFGSSLPKWVGGITNTFDVFGVSVSALVDYKLGHKLISGTHTNAVRHGLDKSTLPGRDVGFVVGEGVLPNGQPNTIQVPVQAYYEAIRTHQTSEQSVFNAGLWQLRQVTVGYDLTDRLGGRLGVDGLRVNLSANNVAVLKKWVPHIHPEQNGIIADTRMGLESTGLPVTRGVGLNVTVRF